VRFVSFWYESSAWSWIGRWFRVASYIRQIGHGFRWLESFLKLILKSSKQHFRTDTNLEIY
jgi:hypothetical protein